MDEPTAWEDINPPMASARHRGPLSTCSADDPRIVFRNELTACLALTAPVGMTEQSRREWLAVAWDTLKHLDTTAIRVGARKARLTCDHPSKIVPAIIRAVEEEMPWRTHYSRPERAEEAKQIGVEYVTPEEVAQIKAEVAAELEAERAAKAAQ